MIAKNGHDLTWFLVHFLAIQPYYLILDDKNTLKIHFQKFDICVENIKSWYQLQLQNHNVMWHHNSFYNYTIINMNL